MYWLATFISDYHSHNASQKLKGQEAAQGPGIQPCDGVWQGYEKQEKKGKKIEEKGFRPEAL